MDNIFNRQSHQTKPRARVLTRLILKGIEWVLRKSYPTKIPSMVQRGLLFEEQRSMSSIGQFRFVRLTLYPATPFCVIMLFVNIHTFYVSTTCI